MTKGKKLKRLKEILRKEWKLEDDWEVSIIFRGDKKSHIAELGASGPTERGIGGFCYMQCDPDPILFAAERFLLDYQEEWDNYEEGEYEGDAHGLLVAAIK